MKAVEDRSMTERGPLRVVLIEDNPSAAMMVESMLAENGNRDFNCTWCSTLASGLEAIVSTGTGAVAVLLDLKMPKVTGIDALKIIKADENLKMIPIVVLSSSREEPDLIECYKHGVNAYVVKPVDFTEFMKAVKMLGVFWVAVNEPPPAPHGKEAVAV